MIDECGTAYKDNLEVLRILVGIACNRTPCTENKTTAK